VTNAPELGLDLVQEAWLNDQLLATIRNIAGEWMVTFFPSDQFCELSWEHLITIQQSFARFIQEQRN
jgi:hypothetical protein